MISYRLHMAWVHALERGESICDPCNLDQPCCLKFVLLLRNAERLHMCKFEPKRCSLANALHRILMISTILASLTKIHNMMSKPYAGNERHACLSVTGIIPEVYTPRTGNPDPSLPAADQMKYQMKDAKD